jgi:hypothetical protein
MLHQSSNNDLLLFSVSPSPSTASVPLATASTGVRKK